MKKMHTLAITAAAAFAMCGAYAQSADPGTSTSPSDNGSYNGSTNSGNYNSGSPDSTASPSTSDTQTQDSSNALPGTVNASGTSAYGSTNTEIPTRMQVKQDARAMVAAGAAAQGESPNYPLDAQRAMGTSPY